MLRATRRKDAQQVRLNHSFFIFYFLIFDIVVYRKPCKMMQIRYEASVITQSIGAFATWTFRWHRKQAMMLEPGTCSRRQAHAVK